MPETTKGMKSIGPKALLSLNSKYTVLDKQILAIKSINRRNKIFISTGFQHSKVLKIANKYRNVQIINEKNYEKYNQCKHIINYIEHISELEDVFIINNGILFKDNCFDRLTKNNPSTIYIIDKNKEDFELGCQSQDSQYLFYGLPRKWTECIFLNKSLMQKILEMHKSQDISNYFLFEIINMIYDNHEINESIVSYKNIMKINNCEDIRRAKRFL